MNMKKALILISLLATVALVPAQQYQLKINAKAGQTFKYVMDIISAGPQASKIGMQMNMKITKVEKGQFTVTTTMGGMTMNGSPAPPTVADQIKQMVLINVMDSRGKVLKSEAKGLPGMPSGNQGTSVPFPAKPIRIGNTWTGEADIQGKKIKTSYKLIAVKQVAGKQAAVIHATPQNVPQMTLDGPIVFSVELATGFPISMSMSGRGGPGTVKMTLRRI
jgi:hypothetical protein